MRTLCSILSLQSCLCPHVFSVFRLSETPVYSTFVVRRCSRREPHSFRARFLLADVDKLLRLEHFPCPSSTNDLNGRSCKAWCNVFAGPRNTRNTFYACCTCTRGWYLTRVVRHGLGFSLRR